MRRIVFSAIVLMVAMGAACAWADVTKETFTRSSGFGGSGAFEGTTVTRIQGHKQSETSNIKFTGAFLSKMAGAGETTTITRVDKGVVWTLDPKKKSYTEQPIAGFDLDDESEDYGDEEAEAPRARVTKNSFSVKKTGASQTINGFTCEEYLMTWLMELQDIETGEKTLNTMETRLWTTPETVAIKKLIAEESAFSKALLQKMGMPFSPDEMNQFGIGVFALMAGAPEDELMKGFSSFKKEMGKVKGYPIRTVVSWKVKSDRIKTPGGDDRASSDGMTDGISIPAGAEDGLSSLGSFVSKAAKDKLAGGSAPKEDAPFFSSTTEIKSISIDSVPASVFEVPAGFKKR
ncbi:MAG: hypothetical protein WAR22_06430 [Desulfomonilia bacterium]